MLVWISQTALAGFGCKIWSLQRDSLCTLYIFTLALFRIFSQSRQCCSVEGSWMHEMSGRDERAVRAEWGRHWRLVRGVREISEKTFLFYFSLFTFARDWVSGFMFERPFLWCKTKQVCKWLWIESFGLFRQKSTKKQLPVDQTRCQAPFKGLRLDHFQDKNIFRNHSMPKF